MMKAATVTFATLLQLILWIAASASAAEVPVVFAKYSNISYTGTRPFSDAHGDALFRGCNPPFSEISSLYIPGVFQTKTNVIESLPNGTEYCKTAGQGESFFYYYGTTGRIFFHSRMDSINLANSVTVFFTLDDNYNPTNIKHLSTSFYGPATLSNGAMYGTTSDGQTNGPMVVDFANGEWTFQFVNGTFPKNISARTCSFGLSQLRSGPVDNNLQPQLYCLQSDFTWAYVQQPVYTDLDQYDNTNRAFWFNGEDIISFISYSSTGVATGGSFYLGKLDGTVVASFNMIDLGENFDYVRDDKYSWADDVIWVTKDVALVLTNGLPEIYNDTGAQSGGCIVVVVRGEDGKWKMTAKIKLDDSLPDVSAAVFRRTKSNVIVHGYRYQNRLIYTYPLCFKDPLDLTCKQNIQLSSCDQNNPPALTDAYSYVDDDCIAPEVSVQSINFTDSTVSAVLRFERFGVNVGQCTATFTCASNTPRGKTSASNRMAAQVSGIVTLFAVIFVAIM